MQLVEQMSNVGRFELDGQVPVDGWKQRIPSPLPGIGTVLSRRITWRRTRALSISLAFRLPFTGSSPIAQASRLAEIGAASVWPYVRRKPMMIATHSAADRSFAALLGSRSRGSRISRSGDLSPLRYARSSSNSGSSPSSNFLTGERPESPVFLGKLGPSPSPSPSLEPVSPLLTDERLLEENSSMRLDANPAAASRSGNLASQPKQCRTSRVRLPGEIASDGSRSSWQGHWALYFPAPSVRTR